MTKSEKFIHERKWLKTNHFAVTNSLRSKLEASGLPVLEQERLAYIQNKVLMMEDEEEAGMFSNVHRRIWSDKCGGNYKRYIETLCEWNQLEVNKKYSTGIDGKGFTKS
jgi:hypothetical protein